MALHSTLASITARIIQRSGPTRTAYLAQLQAAATRGRSTDRMGCANLAHAVAGMPLDDRFKVITERAPNIAIVTAYNDMLSAHTPLKNYPDLIKDEARKHGATAQVAGGVPAMCDGVTQGTSGMELSLFSRDVIAMATAVALSHDMFDAALMLGVCDKIVPGLLIGALHFGHLPTVFVPAGPMPSGLPNKEKARIRELAAQGLVGREGLLDAELKSYHSPGTCTFYGTANSNQLLLEAMGLHVPGTAFVNPGVGLRDELTREAARTVLGRQTKAGGGAVRAATSVGARCAPIGLVVDERAIVNAMVALLATGGSTNHLIHWVAVAHSAGIVIDWNDFSDLSHATPLLARVYPNGVADVNQFQAAGGPGFVIRELIDSGAMHADVSTVAAGGLRAYGTVPAQVGDRLQWSALPAAPIDDAIVRTAAAPFSAEGGCKLLTGNLGRAVIKVSSVPEDRLLIEAPAIVFHDQNEVAGAFKRGELNRDFVAVVRFQGPQANGMPELHKLTPTLSLLQDRGHRIALLTDGRMSGASGRVPAAIHVTPEAVAGGNIAKIRDGDLIRLDAVHGRLDVLIEASELDARLPQHADLTAQHSGMGRELFGLFRQASATADLGAGVL